METGTSSPPIPNSDGSWPKRASKACCNCRRDKVRCDGERPCSGCIRKGFVKEKCIDGCPPCRRSRARCEGGNPCSRCIEIGIDCIDPSSPSLSLDGSSASNTPAAATSSRAKLACLACRRDNKKCDDIRPCSRCISREEECVHVGRAPKAVGLRCINCRKDNKKCEDSRPCSQCKERGIQCTDAMRKRFSRVKMACANCRRQKVQCGPDRPCPSCIRRGLECLEPVCTCTESDSKHGTCSFCRERNPAIVSQTLEEEHTRFPSTPSSSLALPGFNEAFGFLDIETQPPRYGLQHIQQHQLTDPFPTSAPLPEQMAYRETFIEQHDALYSHPRREVFFESSPSTNSFQYYERANTHEDPRNITSQSHLRESGLQSGLPNGHTLPSLIIPNSVESGGDSLDRSLPSKPQPRLPDPSRHPIGFSGQEEPAHSYLTQSETSDSLSTNTRGISKDHVSVVGVGTGVYASAGRASFESFVSPLDDAFSPAPMTMPMPLPVSAARPVLLRDAIASGEGLAGTHPQFSEGSYHLPSNFNTASKRGED